MKAGLLLAARVIVLPIVLLFQTYAAIAGRDRAFASTSQSLALIPGLTGQFLRRAFLQWVLPHCGPDVCVCFGTLFSHADVCLGDRCYVGNRCMLGQVDIGEDVLLGSDVSIINGNRQHGIDRLDVPVREQPGQWPTVTIGKDTWVGDRAIVMANLGKHCVVGAGSVVTKPVEDYAIVVGNPARVIGDRRELKTDSANGGGMDE